MFKTDLTRSFWLTSLARAHGPMETQEFHLLRINYGLIKEVGISMSFSHDLLTCSDFTFNSWQKIIIFVLCPSKEKKKNTFHCWQLLLDDASLAWNLKMHHQVFSTSLGPKGLNADLQFMMAFRGDSVTAREFNVKMNHCNTVQMSPSGAFKSTSMTAATPLLHWCSTRDHVDYLREILRTTAWTWSF